MRLSKIKYATQRALINVVCYFFDAIFLTFIKSANQFHGKKNVLITRPDAIGDFIIWSDSAKAYRKIYPKDEFDIYLLGNPICEELALKSGCFDHFIPFDRIKFMLNFFYRFEKWKVLRSMYFETLLYPSYSREFATGDLLIRGIKAANKIGIKSDNAIDDFFWSEIGDLYFTRLLEIPQSKDHELIKNENFVKGIGFSNFKASVPDLSFCNDPDFKLTQFIKTISPSSASADERLNEKYFIIAPGARIALRQWPLTNFTIIADYISQKTGWNGIVIGSANEYELCKMVQMSSKSRLLNLAGKTSLMDMIQVIGKSQLFVGNETAGIHIAIAQKTPSICILGGGHFSRFMPYPVDLLSKNQTLSSSAIHKMPCFNCDWNCIYKTGRNKVVPCVENISIEAVKNEIDLMLK